MSWAEETFNTMTIEERAAQLLISYSIPELNIIEDMFADGSLGNFWQTPGRNTTEELVNWTNKMQREAKYPILFGCDGEKGTQNVLVTNGTDLPSQMAIGATGDSDNAKNVGAIVGEEVKALGYHLMAAPIVDININPDNPIINIRSYGQFPQLVTEMAVAYVEGFQENGIFATAKHFPGHGDVAQDSHRELPRLDKTLEEIEQVELIPYRACIKAGVKAIMTAHIIFPAIDDLPATLSKKIMTGLLRKQLQFDGLVVTDAMAMHAIAHNYGFDESVQLAANAGCDLLIVSEPKKSYDALVKGIAKGTVNVDRINESCMRILKAKEELGLMNRPQQDVERTKKIVGFAAHKQYAETLCKEAITLQGASDALPLAKDKKIGLITITNYPRGENMPAEFTWLKDNAPLLEKYLHEELPDVVTYDLEDSLDEEKIRHLAECDVVVAGLFIWIMPYLAEGGVLPQEKLELIKELFAKVKPDISAVFGNPYVVRALPEIQNVIFAYDDAPAAVKVVCDALLGKIPCKGTLPITLT